MVYSARDILDGPRAASRQNTTPIATTRSRAMAPLSMGYTR